MLRLILLFSAKIAACSAFTPSNGVTQAAFVTAPTTKTSKLVQHDERRFWSSRSTLSSSANNNGDKKEEDLFDYFDPRLSPHEYPNGIDENASASPSTSSNKSYEEEYEEDRLNPFGTSNNKPSSLSDTPQSSSTAAVDVFDPRISPHEYPNGIPDKVGVASTTTPTTKKQLEESFNNNKNNDVFDPRISPHEYSTGTPDTIGTSTANNLKKEEVQQRQEVFDPTLSPHAYPNGTPDTIGHVTSSTITSSTTTTKVGILLIDHGSKRSKSNLHLETLAQVYQQQYSSCEKRDYEYVVKAAHMEIASPDIESGMRMLIEEGVGKIICHPYFLSPGKHATKDIPRLVEKAISSIDMPHIPVITTEPVGTRLNVMVDVINGLVEESLQTLDDDDDDDDYDEMGGVLGSGVVSGEKVGVKNKEWELGGFFGDVKRMLEEEEDNEKEGQS